MIVEFSRPVTVEEIPTAGRTWVLDATAAECELLAKRFGILAVSGLTAKIKVKPAPHGDIIRVKGSLSAQVVQACVVHLTPVEQQVDEEFDLCFAPAADEDQAGAELDIDLSADDPPDPIYGGVIDLGEICAEHLALGLDPFPRSEGAEFTAISESCDDEPEQKPSPFAVLAQLAEKKI